MTFHRADRIQGTQRLCRGDFSTTNAARLHTGWVGFSRAIRRHTALRTLSLHGYRGRLIGWQTFEPRDKLFSQVDVFSDTDDPIRHRFVHHMALPSRSTW